MQHDHIGQRNNNIIMDNYYKFIFKGFKWNIVSGKSRLASACIRIYRFYIDAIRNITHKIMLRDFNVCNSNMLSFLNDLAFYSNPLSYFQVQAL